MSEKPGMKTAAPQVAYRRGQKPSPSRQVAQKIFSSFAEGSAEGQKDKEIQSLMTFASVRRDNIRQKAIDQLMESFPVKQGEYEVHLEDAYVDESEATPTKERQAKLEGKSLFERIRGDVVLKDKNGKVVEKKKDYTLAKLPYFTDDHAFLIEGTPYVPRNQLRTRPGVFTRRRGNDDIEASFNMAKGANFRIAMAPETGIFNMEFGTTKIPLYPVLRAFGLSHASISMGLGKELSDMNQKTDRKREQAVDKLYKKVIPSFKRDAVSIEGKINQIKQYFDTTSMDGDVNRRTLGSSFDKLSPEALMSAAKKLVGVFRGDVETDDRDSLAYQKIVGIEDFISEKIKLDMKDVSSKIKTKIRFPKKGGVTIKNVLPQNAFGKGIQNFITTSSVVTTPTGINPLERLDSMATVTRLGEGAIGSERAIPMEARRLHGTHLGILGPLRTPESSRAGIDVRTALYAAKDKDGILHTPVKNLQTGRIEYKSIDELENEPIAFPEQETRKGNIDVLFRGKTKKMKPGEVKYQIPNAHAQYSISANMAPQIEGMQGNRGIMASKMVTQALPLVNAEEPLVQVESANRSLFGTMEEQAASLIEAISPVDGIVDKIDNDYIHLKEDGTGEVFKISYQQNVPYAKTRFHQKVSVKVGDRVKKLDQLTQSNFTRNKKLTLGTNLTTAYIADNGYNTDDAVTISEGASKKLTSEHMYTEKLLIDDSVKLGMKMHATHCPNLYTRQQYSKLDLNGVVKKGEKLKHGDVIIAAVRKTELSAEDQQLGRLHKALVKNYVDASTVWEKNVEGEVKDVIVTPSRVTVTILSKEPAKVGDKLAGMYGNKGVIGRIVPDTDMLKNEEGKPIDLLFTSAGVISRINPSQITASAMGKAAKKLGKPFVVRNFDQNVKNNVELARDSLKKAGYTGKGVNGKETLTDPVNGRKIDNIFVGENYVLKLFKTTESNFAARNIGGYDALDQPLKGGDRASKSTGNLEVNGLLAHNARGYLADVTNIKSNKNGDYWRAVQMGYPPPAPDKNTAFSKFSGMLRASGINLHERPNGIVMAPMTDNDVLKMSNGEILNQKRVRSKDLKPEKGGLFDEAVTGGLTGSKWGHVDFGEPLVNPLFFEPARRLLGKTNKDMEKMVAEQDGNQIRQELNKIDVASKLQHLKKQVRIKKGVERDDIVKQIKYLQSLDANGVKAGDAYTLSKFPVLPPSMRPLLPAGNNKSTLIVDDANFLYRDLLMSKQKFQELKEIPGMPREFINQERKTLFDSIKAVVGIGDPVSPQSQSRKAKGFISNIAGTNPKHGFFQRKIIKRKMDLSGSGTVALNPNLGIDDVEVPEDMGWNMYQPFIIKRMVEQGMSRQDAMKNWEDKTPVARASMIQESQDRPMVINRAPSLHRWSLLGVKPKFIQGKTVRVNPYLTGPMNMDFDGDSVIGNIFIGLDSLIAKSTKKGRDKNTKRWYKEVVPQTQKETTMFQGKLLHAGLRSIDIKDFPRIQNTRKVSDEGKITYDVPEGVVVPSVDKDGNWGLLPVTKFHIHPRCHRWDVTTHLGRELTCSANHSVVVLDEESLELVKCRPKDALSKCAPIMGGLPDTEHTEASMKVASLFNASTNSSKELVDEIPLDKDFGWFLGVYIGDGWNTTRNERLNGTLCLSYGKNGEAVPPRWHAIAKKLFTDGEVHAGSLDLPHEFEGGKYTSHRMSISSKPLALFIDSLGMGHGAKEKRLPTGFLQMPLEFRQGLFEGLMDTDGSISITKATDKKRKHPKMNVGFTTISEELASEVLLLGQSLGLIGNITTSKGRAENRQESHYVTFNGRSICDAEWLSLTSEHKHAALEEARQYERNPGRNDIVPFPGQIGEMVLGWLRNNGATKRKDQPYNKVYNASYVVLSKKMKNQERYITREQFLKISDACEALKDTVYFAKWLDLCNNPDMSWDYVKEAKDTKNYQKMYDLTVPDTWTFTMANGLAVWDTAILSVPATDAGKKDVKNMMLSKQMFSDKKRGDLLVSPVHESIFGWTKATEAMPTSNTVKKFKRIGDAVQAYRTGQIGEADLVDFDD